jgi:hypothetical protein
VLGFRALAGMQVSGGRSWQRRRRGERERATALGETAATTSRGSSRGFPYIRLPSEGPKPTAQQAHQSVAGRLFFVTNIILPLFRSTYCLNFVVAKLGPK